MRRSTFRNGHQMIVRSAFTHIVIVRLHRLLPQSERLQHPLCGTEVPVEEPSSINSCHRLNEEAANTATARACSIGGMSMQSARQNSEGSEQGHPSPSIRCCFAQLTSTTSLVLDLGVSTGIGIRRGDSSNSL